MKKIATNYGLKMFIGFALLFFVAHLLGWSENHYLRILNGFIHITFIYLAIGDYRKTYPESHNNYVSGVSVGIFTSMIGVILFTLSMSAFLTFIDPAFFGRIKAQAPFPAYFNQLTASLFIFVEGVGVSLIGSYLVMRIIDAKRENVIE